MTFKPRSRIAEQRGLFRGAKMVVAVSNFLQTWFFAEPQGLQRILTDAGEKVLARVMKCRQFTTVLTGIRMGVRK